MGKLNAPRRPLPVGQILELKLSASEARLERTSKWVKDTQEKEKERIKEKRRSFAMLVPKP